MKLNFKSRITSAILAMTVALGSAGIYGTAQEAEPAADTIEIIFTDVTDTRTDVLEGEAKIMVSVKGAEGIASIAQTSLTFSGDLKYKSITFLQGENNPPKCFLYSPNAALVNSKKMLMPSIISTDKSIEVSDITDLFVLTFEGDPEDTVTLTLEDPDKENTYCIIGGEQYNASEAVSITAAASEKAVEGKTASIQLTMDTVTDFSGPASSGYKSSGVELRITGEDNEGYTIYTVLNNANISKGGHRVGTSDSSVPTFIIENTVIKDDTYTVEISGIGYVPYVMKNVDFDEPLELTNADFIPGDVDGDGEVTSIDRDLCTETIAEKEYNEACDFNRDEKVDKYDLKVFEGIKEDGDDEEDKTTVPGKISELTAEGANKSVTLTWTAPENGGSDITGYTISYGKTEEASDSEKKVGADAVTVTIDGLEDDTTYYFAITAENKNGSSEKATASAKTNASDQEQTETVPGKITTVKSSSVKSSSFVITWDAPADGGSEITGYTLKYGTTKSKLSSTKNITDTKDLEYKLSSLSSGKTYYYQIAAKNKIGTGEYSDIKSVTTTGGSDGPSGPTGPSGPSTPPVSTPTYYTITFNIGEGTIISGSATVKAEKNAKVSGVPTVKAPEGKEFVGWSRDNGATTIDPANVTVSSNLTFTAVYKDAVKEEKPETGNTSDNAESFTDLENHAWAKESIYELKNKGVINGTSETTYSPANNIKRGDFILILVRMLGIDAEYTENFADVPADSYYADAIGKAKAAGIAKGSGDNFMPEQTITRQDLITLAYRAFLAKGYITEAEGTESLDEFSDKAEISDYAVSAMASMVKAGIIKGSDGKVNPANNATRAEVAVMCARLLALMK